MWTRRVAAALCVLLLSSVPVSAGWASTGQLPSRVRDPAGIVAQPQEPDVDRDRPIPPERDEAVGESGRPLLWMLAGVLILGVVGVIAWLWLRTGRAVAGNHRRR